MPGKPERGSAGGPGDRGDYAFTRIFADAEKLPADAPQSCSAHLQQHEAAGGLFWSADGALQTLLWDAGGIVAAPAEIKAAGLRITVPVGAQVNRDGDRALVIASKSPPIDVSVGPAAEGTTSEIEVSLEPGADEGRVRFEAVLDGFQPEMRYFYGSSPIQSCHFPVIGPGAGLVAGTGSGAVHATVRFDPHRPSDREAAFIAPAAPGPAIATNFRTPFGNSLSLSPAGGGYVYEYDPVLDAPYLTITGRWTLGAGTAGATGGTAPPPPVQLVCGLSGSEYLEIGPSGVVEFTRGSAYATSFGATAAAGATLLLGPTAPGAKRPVLTPYVSAGGAGYYAQPERSALFTPPAAPTGPFLQPFAVMAAALPAGMSAAFPVAPFSAATGGTALAQFEATVLSPARRSAISLAAAGPVSLADAWAGATGGTGPTGPAGPTGRFVDAATPQGLLSRFAVNGGSTMAKGDWATLTLASSDGGAARLQLTEVQGPLRSALLTGQLFLVVSAPDKLLAACSVNYRIDAEAITASGATPEVAACVRYLKNIVYDSLSYFTPVLKAALGPALFPEWGPKLTAAAQYFELTIQGWTFRLSPADWPKHGTIMILKFADAPLEDLAANLGLWTEAGRFNDDPAATQAALVAFLQDAQTRQATSPVFSYFAETVAANRQVGGGGTQIWTGVLFLNCTTPIDQLPPQLAGLAAGIDQSAFFAHHVGINVSPLDYAGGAKIALRDSSLFGLINYDDPGDLVYRSEPYDFKVLSLTVSFAASQIASFDSRIELMVGNLFGELSTLQDSEHGNNLILSGSYQEHDGKKAYVFLQQGVSRFAIASKVLASVEIDKVQFATLLGAGGGGTVTSRFTFWGSIRFLDQPGFDLFSFGPDYDANGNLIDGRIAFSNMAVTMTFDPSAPPPSGRAFAFGAGAPDPSGRTFAFGAGALVLDPSQSRARASSLAAGFPLTLNAILQGEENSSPAALGFITVQTPLPGQQLGYPWFGLQFALNLGSPGALAAKAGFTATLLAAWSPEGDQAQVFTGLKLPGSTGGKRQLTIEGPLSLDLGGIAFVRTADAGYMLRVSNIALSLLGLKFPPGGKTEILLFGNPRSNQSTTLGWYAAYQKDAGATGASGPSRPLLIEAEV